MLKPLKLLLDEVFCSTRSIDELAKKSNVRAATIATIRTRSRQGTDSVSLENLCKLALAGGQDPLLALLSFTNDRVATGKDELGQELMALLVDGLEELAAFREDSKQKSNVGRESMSLMNFPGSFQEPFKVVTGDRRESGGKKITPADFGALSASPADIRWLYQLGLPKDTEIITDKIFALAPFEELSRRLSCATLICVGSPASNHLARILNRYSLFRFNLPPFLYDQSECLIRDAWSKGAEIATRKPSSERDFFVAPRAMSNFDYDALEKFRAERDSEIRHLKHAVFSGGFIDPTYAHSIRGLDKTDDRDFGLVTMAQNPFRPEPDSRYPAILFAGYHLPGTCRSLAPTLWSRRADFFNDHPYGGIIRVDLKPSRDKDFYPFYERMENFDVKWDDESAYLPHGLLDGLKVLSERPSRSCHISQQEAKRAYQFLQDLISVAAHGTAS